MEQPFSVSFKALEGAAQGGGGVPQVSREGLGVALSALGWVTRLGSVTGWALWPWRAFPTSVVL